MDTTIVCVAIKTENGVVHSVPKPYRHHSLIYCLVMYLGYDTPITGEQGFLLANGKFIDRKEGYIIANNTNQIKRKDKINYSKLLFSEDLW